MAAFRQGFGEADYVEGAMSVPITGTPGAAWLAARGIDLDAVGRAGLRFHPRCPWGTGAAPCTMTSLVDFAAV